MGPQTSAVVAMTPVTCLTDQKPNAVVVGGQYEWAMESGNGWKIVARGPINKACGEAAQQGYPYEVAFYRPGESSPFERRSATLFFSLWERTNYRFSISQQDPKENADVQNMGTLMQKTMDPKLTPA